MNNMVETKILSAKEFLDCIDFEPSQTNPKLIYFKKFLPSITDLDWLNAVESVTPDQKLRFDDEFKDIILEDYVIATHLNFQTRYIFLSPNDCVQCRLILS